MNNLKKEQQEKSIVTLSFGLWGDQGNCNIAGKPIGGSNEVTGKLKRAQRQMLPSDGRGHSGPQSMRR